MSVSLLVSHLQNFIFVVFFSLFSIYISYRCKDYMDYLKRYHKDKEAEIEQTKKLFKEHQQQQMQEIAVKKGSGTDSLSNHQQQQQKSTNKRPRTQHVSRPLSTNEEEAKTLTTKVGAAIADADDDGIASGGEEAVMDEHQSCADDMSGLSDDEGSSCGTPPPDRTSTFVNDKDESNVTNSSNNLGGNIVLGGAVQERNADDDQSVAASSASSTAAVVVRGLRSSKQHKKRIRVDHCSSRSRIKLSPPSTIGEEGMTNNYNNTKEGSSSRSNVVSSIVTASTSHHGKKLKRRGFHYDYREVFLKSNIPQFIATLSGRIVVCEYMRCCLLTLMYLLLHMYSSEVFHRSIIFTCDHFPVHIKTGNDTFLLASGLSERDVQRLTLFSIVESCQLSIMYKMVARALADEKKSVVHPTTADTTSCAIAAKNDIISSSHATTTTTGQTITLKCIPFTRSSNNNNSKTNERMIARSKASMVATDSDVVITHNQASNPLYINVALMDDDDREKRCFHCILTDCPPRLNGKLGGVTPELFAKLFESPNSGTKKEVVA